MNMSKKSVKHALKKMISSYQVEISTSISYMHTYIHTYIHIYVYMYIYANIFYICMYVCMYVYTIVNVSREDFPSRTTQVDIVYVPSAAQAAWGVFLRNVRKQLNLEYIELIIDKVDMQAIHRIQRLKDDGEYFVRVTETSGIWIRIYICIYIHIYIYIHIQCARAIYIYIYIYVIMNGANE